MFAVIRKFRLRPFAVARSGEDHVVSTILGSRSTQDLEQMVSPQTALGALHALISWILAFRSAGEGYGFPFDLPYLTLYQRIVAVHRLLDRSSTIWPDKLTGATASIDGCRSRAPEAWTAWGTAAGLGEYSLPHGRHSHDVAVSPGQGGADDVTVLAADRDGSSGSKAGR